jgi:hypothetical protein
MGNKNRNAALVLAFNRAEATELLINKLISFGVSNIYISVDGPRNPRDLEAQKRILEYLASKNQDLGVSIKIKRNVDNLGLAVAILSALNWFFANEKCGYILEDDLDFNSDFLDFCDHALVHFDQDPEVWLVSGNQYSLDPNPGIWVNYPLIWGWATWRRKWEEIEKQILERQLVSDQSIQLKVISFWQLGNWRAQKGIIDSWAVPFAANMRLQKKFCLLPPVNLVSNIGVEDSASHTTENAWHTNWSISNELSQSNYRNLWLSAKNLNAIHESNTLLEERIYKIRTRHSFSTPISRFLDQIRSRSKRGSLEETLSQESIAEYL